jgi:hypothetical protein
MRHLFASLLLLLFAVPLRAELTSEVRPLHGVPALYINGQLHSQIFAAPYRAGAANIADLQDFSAAGIDSFNIYLRFPWTAEETYDFAPVDAKLDALLAANPSARFIPRVLLTPGRWFAEKYPDEISRRDDGSPAGMFPSQNAGNNPSFSSDIYRRLSRKAMDAFIKHVEQKYGDHIIGYQVGNGFGGEWLPFNSFWEIRPGGTPPDKFGVEDYSPAALKHFRQWLSAKYKTDAALQAAWKDPTDTLATATIPNEKDRYTTTRGIFFDPAGTGGAGGMRCPDWFTFYNESVADVLLENAAWVKELTGRKKIVGAFYGYLWCNFPNLSAVHSGQLAFAKVLRSPNLDFIASCYTYDHKQIGGPNNSQSLPHSVALHGKLYFNEVDTETHLRQRQWRWGDSLNNPKNFDETRALLLRDYAYALTNGNGMWWTDLHGGTFHDPQIIALFKQLKDIDDKYRATRPRSNADIAVILDEASFTYTGDGEPLWNALLTAQKQWHFAFIGAPWDCHLLTDIDNPNLRHYKFYIFLNTFKVTPAQRTAIHAKLQKNNATALWVYAPGYIGEDKCSVEYASALTGIKLAEEMTPGELHVDITPEADWAKLVSTRAYGTDVHVSDIIRFYDHQVYLKDPRDPSLRRDLPGFRIAPRLYVDDPQALAFRATLAGVNRTGLAFKQQDGWNSIYSSAPLIPAELVRRMAGTVHIYTDGNDNVYANDAFLAIYSPKGGQRTIKLPGKSTILNLLDNQTLAIAATEFRHTFKENETILLKVDPSN